MSCCFSSTLASRKKDETGYQGPRASDLGTVKQFSYKELKSATEKFNFINEIGRGGFGTVYKGILKTGDQVAVKKLSVASKQGLREFLAEIEAISNVHHPNLVELIGCCVEKNMRILVYKFIENKSLDKLLLGNKSENIGFDWARRSAICIGTARGLAFLHEELVPHVVHRDIKASNVLLDEHFLPKIGDFGLAKLFPDDITHISTRIAGTTGYLAPEYALAGQLTVKADVYSFGVLVLEIISGRNCSRPSWGNNAKPLLEWAWNLHEEGKLVEMVDPKMGEFPEQVVMRYVKVAFFCTQAVSNRRPLMSQVVEMLSHNVTLNDHQLTPPGFFQTFTPPSSTSISNHDITISPIPITQLSPR